MVDFLYLIPPISDAKLLSNKPEAGMSYANGQTCYTTVLFGDTPVKALLDIGAFCSCTSSKFLDQAYPSWQDNLLSTPRAKFSSCHSAMKTSGVVIMPLIFPHSRDHCALPLSFLYLVLPYVTT
jgi:hypothetical protein